jgi:hypothetical protein
MIFGDRKSFPALILGAGLLSLAILPPACKSPSIEQVQASLEVVDLGTKWVVKEYRQWPEPKLTLVPVIQFRIKNLTAEPFKYIKLNAIFKKKLQMENLGDCFLPAIRNEPIPPGGLSEVLVMKSNYGRTGRNLDNFKMFPSELDYDVKLFAQFKGSRHALLGEWKMSHDIDFKEDPPVHMEGKKIGKTEAAEPVKK